jgi:hypothetical protein
MVFWQGCKFLATNTGVPGSIPGVPDFSEQLWVWTGVHSVS